MDELPRACIFRFNLTFEKVWQGGGGERERERERVLKQLTLWELNELQGHSLHSLHPVAGEVCISL